jgi:hypothetical protein
MSSATAAAPIAGAAMMLSSSATTGSISGTVFSDNNKNGVLDAGDTNLANRKIYIDANANGKLDTGETAAYSNASGVYTFSNLATGSYRLRRADLPNGYYISTPTSTLNAVTVAAGHALSGVNIGAAIGTAPTGGDTTGGDPPSGVTITGRTGYMGDPKFLAAGNSGTFGNADLLKNLTAYRLQSSSPLINKGVAQPGTLASAIIDFWGDTLPKGGRPDIGVDEVA